MSEQPQNSGPQNSDFDQWTQEMGASGQAATAAFEAELAAKTGNSVPTIAQPEALNALAVGATKAVVNNPEYLQHHPAAIQDVEKARFMATAVNEEESRAARARTRLQSDGSARVLGNVNARTAKREIKDLKKTQKKIDKIYKQSSRVYDETTRHKTIVKAMRTT